MKGIPSHLTSSFLEGIEKRAIEQLGTGEETEVKFQHQMSTAALEMKPEGNELEWKNWYFALGHARVPMNADVTAQLTDGVVSLQIDAHVVIPDTYDWRSHSSLLSIRIPKIVGGDELADAGVIDSDHKLRDTRLGALHRAGLARQFQVRGVSRRIRVNITGRGWSRTMKKAQATARLTTGWSSKK